MQNKDLAADYVKRARIRLKAIEVLMAHQSFADVVRESQEVVELTLKALLRKCGIESPRIHDVSGIMLQERARIPALIQPDVERLAAISKNMRRDQELAFYGSEDLTPSEFYGEDDAKIALTDASFVVQTVSPFVES